MNWFIPAFVNRRVGSSEGTTEVAYPLLNVLGDDWVLAELVPVEPLNNVYSIRLQMEGTVAADFEINDISIVYRMKNIK